MPTFEQDDLVKVPFPYTNRPTRQSRPALVVVGGNRGYDDDALGLLWVVMVTSAENRGWPGDIALPDLAGTGLPAPSLVRTAKIATIGFESLSEMLSTLTPRPWELIQKVKRREPIPIGDLTEPVEHDGTPGRTDVGALVDPGILELNERRRVFVPWDEIDLRVPLAA